MNEERIPINIAYSPDSDDSFMIWALRTKRIPWQEFDFAFHRDDIHVLNKAALNREFDIIAVSMAHYPLIAKDYLLLPVGSSIGENYGPALITHRDSSIRTIADLKHKTIAIPGRTTSAYIAAHSLIGEFTAKEYYFKDIIPAVIAGEVDAGILIHELQMDPEQEQAIRKIGDLGKLWHERYQTALPLGGNAIARDISGDRRRKLTNMLQSSIEYALENRDEALQEALAESQANINPAQASQYIDQYVNQQTVKLDESMTHTVMEFVKMASAVHNKTMRINQPQDIFAI